MLKTIDRYLLRAFLTNYALSLFVLISLYVVLDLFVNFDEFTEGGKGAGTVLYNIYDYYRFNMPLYFSQLSGVITLFAACATLARLQRNNEVTAVLASGTSLYRLATPVILAGMVMNGLLFLDQEYLVPRVAPKLARARDDVEGTRVYQVWCAKEGDHRLVSALQFSPAQGRVRNLIVIELSREPQSRGQMASVVLADWATWDQGRGGWALDRGKRVREKSGPGGTLSGERSLIEERLQFLASELTPDDLLLRKTAQWLNFLSLDQLRRLARRGDADPVQIARIRHGRLTLPISNLILLLLGLAFFMTREPSSVLTQGAKALATCAIAFVVTFIGQQVVGSADVVAALPAWLPAYALPAWVPIFFFGPISVLLMENVKT